MPEPSARSVWSAGSIGAEVDRVLDEAWRLIREARGDHDLADQLNAAAWRLCAAYGRSDERFMPPLRNA